MEDLVKAQLDYFNSNATKSMEFRIGQLNKLYDLLLSNEAMKNYSRCGRVFKPQKSIIRKNYLYPSGNTGGSAL